MELRRLTTMLAFVGFVLTASSVKKVASHGAERTMITLAFAAFVLTASSVLKRWHLIELRRH